MPGRLFGAVRRRLDAPQDASVAGWQLDEAGRIPDAHG